jgi:hypothetical protein
MNKERGNNIDAFAKELAKKRDESQPMILRRVIAKEIDWDAKTMTATDLIDDLDHYDIRLGIGYQFTRPALGSLCLVAIIGKSDVDTILMDAVEVEEIEITDKTGFKWHLNEGKLAINGDAFKGIVKAPELKAQIDKNTAILNALQQAFQSWVVVPNDGGAALKTAVAAIPAMQRADLANIENENITHG